MVSKKSLKSLINTSNDRKNSGFSLIELMVALIVLGILAAVAFPNYSSYMRRSRRSDAMAMLAQTQAILERCYAQNFSYSQACSDLPTFPLTSTQAYYTITLSNLSSSTYTLTATAIGDQAADTSCTTFSVNQTNQKTATNSSGSAESTCW